MKYICLTIILLNVCTKGFNQTLDEIKASIGKGDLANAKKLVDAYMLVEKNAAKADGWYYKGAIYNEYSKKEEWAVSCPTCKLEAFMAFKKYQALDSKNIYMVVDQNVHLFDIYNNFFDLGSKAYGKNEYNNAYNHFVNALSVKEYIYGKGFNLNGFAFTALDTSLALNLALAARLAKKDNEAAKYYEQLVAAGMKGADNLEMYQYLVQHYAESENMQAFDQIISKAKKLYPKDEYWTEAELGLLAKKDKATLFAKYDEIIKADAGSYVMHYNYGVELFNYLYVGDTRPGDFESRKITLENTILKALTLKNSSDANLLLARHYYNQVYDIQAIIKKTKGTSPEDATKRAEWRALALKGTDECIKYAGEATKIYSTLSSLKPVDKDNYKNALAILEAMYGYKGDSNKAAEYKKIAEGL